MIDSTAKATLAITVRCERCEQVFGYECSFSVSRSDSSYCREGECAEELAEMLRECPRGKHLDVHKCPKCSYVQSWMLDTLRKNREFTPLFVSVPLALISCFIVNYQVRGGKGEHLWEWLSLPVLVGFGFVYYRLARALFRVIRGTAESQQRLPQSSVPLEVRITNGPHVYSVRKEYY